MSPDDGICMANTTPDLIDQEVCCWGAALEEGGMGEYWAANCCWDVPVRAAAENGKYVGKWVHLPGMPKSPKNRAMAVGQTCSSDMAS